MGSEQQSDSSTRRRKFLAGAVAGLAGAGAGAAITVGSATPAAAAAGGSDWFDVKEYGAVGDGSTDDTAKVQAAIDAAAAGGGTVYFPTGKYLVKPAGTTPALSVTGNNIRLVGANSKAAMLVKGADGILLRMSGAGADNTGATHRRYCSVDDLGFNGNNHTGLLLELYYTDNCYFRDVFMTSNLDICVDAVEFWDSRFYNLVIESSTGTAGTSSPNIWLRNTSTATSGAWGYSTDNINQIHFTGCRLEAFGTGALWITQGPAAINNPNGIHLTDCKFETSQMQGGPHLKVDASCKHVHASNIYAYAGGFASGYSTAQNIIAWAGIASSLENVLIANGSTATINSGIDLYAGSGTTAVLRDVVGVYGTKPAGAHIYYEASSAGDFLVENCYGNTGTQSSGTIPTRNQPGPRLRLVAGAVSDSSFTRTPLDGTTAVDTANNRLYVRVGGSWMWTQLNS
ncbi:glycosyl hydrolase family 28-related protein [Streptomyces sp. NBC_01478]|uniref:glycosyl hydrolase family 28-related protein n=1 Tax=Streptomyces sp. NBC_01478 TaxID=2903882 RepID=UPI002E331137|nr:glycosyl hydrolase family 28-related protein [Streptomyces sp. NBC_01478]